MVVRVTAATTVTEVAAKVVRMAVMEAAAARKSGARVVAVMEVGRARW